MWEQDMQEPSRPPVAVQKLRRAKRSRDSLIKGTAILLLIIFGTTTIQRYLGPDSVLWLAGGIGVWLLMSVFTRRRRNSAARSDQSESDWLVEIGQMERAEFLEQAMGVLQTQGYETQIKDVSADSATALLLVRGNERVWCLVEYALVDEAVIGAALEALKKTDCQQAMVLSPHKSSAQVQMAALQQGVVLIDQAEFVRLRSLQVKGHRVHAFRSGATDQTSTRMRRRR